MRWPLLLPLLVLPSLGCRGLGIAASPAGRTTSPAPAREEDEESHDVMEGLDTDGRIPKKELPADLPNSERWRYKPEGRIQDGNFFERLFVSTFISPIIFYQGDVGVGGGVALTDIDFRNQRRQEFAHANLSYTTEGQQSYNFAWRRWTDHRNLDDGGVIQEERSYLRGAGGYTKALTRRFFGIGPDTTEDDESSYTDEVAAIELGVQEAIPEPGSDWVVGASLRAEARNLGSGFVSGADDMQDAYPGLFHDGDSLASLWVLGGVRYDTRDSQHSPYRGGTLGAWIRAVPLMTGERSGIIYGMDSTLVVPLPNLFHDGGVGNEENPPTDVLAFTAQVEDSSGDLPFWALPSLGGSYRLRGYIQNRWTDSAAWFAGTEYRLVTVPRGMVITDEIRIERIGAALFYELGAVGPSIGELGASRVRDSYGISLRANLERAALFRFDLGFSAEGSNLSFVYGLSF